MVKVVQSIQSNITLLKKFQLIDSAKFENLVRLHLSFVVDLSADVASKLGPSSLPNDLCDATTTPRNLTRSSKFFKKFKFLPRSSNNSHTIKNVVDLFGKSLTAEGIAATSQLICYLSAEENIVQEGLFRKSGSATRQDDLKRKLNAGTTVDFHADRFTVHDVATVLKSFLRDLPEPLVTDVQCYAYTEIYDLVKPEMSKVEQAGAKHKQLTAMQLLNLMLPPVNAELLRELLTFLHDVAARSELNKMTADNLGIIFAPLLLGSKEMSGIDLKHRANRQAELVANMIRWHSKLFEPPSVLMRDVIVQCAALDATQGPSLQPKESFGLRTTVAFNDQVKSAKLEQLGYGTDRALAELYAHVQQMPEGREKQKLVKQFQKHSREQNIVGLDGANSSRLSGRLFTGSSIKQQSKWGQRKLSKARRSTASLQNSFVSTSAGSTSFGWATSTPSSMRSYAVAGSSRKGASFLDSTYDSPRTPLLPVADVNLSAVEERTPASATALLRRDASKRKSADSPVVRRIKRMISEGLRSPDVAGEVGRSPVQITVQQYRKSLRVSRGLKLPCLEEYQSRCALANVEKGAETQHEGKRGVLRRSTFSPISVTFSAVDENTKVRLRTPGNRNSLYVDQA